MSITDAAYKKSVSSPSMLRFGSKGYVVSPLYDWLFFIGSPILALVIGLGVYGTPLNAEREIFGRETSLVDVFIGAFIFAHLIIVIFRSHLNPKIFKLYPYRFTLVPILLFFAMASSNVILISCSVLATFWDVYHSGMQTFGLSRIYDAKAGNDPIAGRKLDWILNILLYAGPIVAGASLLAHVNDFREFKDIGYTFFTAVPAYANSYASVLAWSVMGFGSLFVAYYCFSYWRLYKQGYKVSPQKIALLASTGICSIYVWGFNPFGMAFFIMNFFHALQYFAIVYWMEKGNISRVIGCENRAWAKTAVLGVLLVTGFSYGMFVEVMDVERESWFFALFLVISLMHFWYDGFVWSVRRKQV